MPASKAVQALDQPPGRDRQGEQNAEDHEDPINFHRDRQIERDFVEVHGIERRRHHAPGEHREENECAKAGNRLEPGNARRAYDVVDEVDDGSSIAAAPSNDPMDFLENILQDLTL